MDSAIPEYALQRTNTGGQAFEIKRMEDIFDAAGGIDDVPHRHHYYTILLVDRASGTHTIDFEEYPLGAHCVHFVSPGQVHQVHTPERPEGLAFLFGDEFLLRNSIRREFIRSINLFQPAGSTPPLQLGQEQYQALKAIADQIMQEFQSQSHLSYEALGAWLKIFLIRCNEYCELPEGHTQQMEAGKGILLRFRDLAEMYFQEQHQVQFYAEQLHVSSEHLNRTVKSLIGQTAKEYLQGRITQEARRLLYHTDQSAKEIAFELGFEDPSHFSSFFRNCTGKSPSQWRKALKV